MVKSSKMPSQRWELKVSVVIKDENRNNFYYKYCDSVFTFVDTLNFSLTVAPEAYSTQYTTFKLHFWEEWACSQF